MSSGDSVSQWINALKGGDARAAQKLWERFFCSLVALARKRLPSNRRREADEEDVALSAFDHFFRGIAQGRFPQLSDRNSLWRLLIVLTTRKANDLVAGVAARAAALVPEQERERFRRDMLPAVGRATVQVEAGAGLTAEQAAPRPVGGAVTARRHR